MNMRRDGAVGPGGYNVIDLTRNADAAMYHSKKSGGNMHSYYEPTMNDAAVDRLMTKSRLKRAFERDELLVHYQPKYNLEHRRRLHGGGTTSGPVTAAVPAGAVVDGGLRCPVRDAGLRLTVRTLPPGRAHFLQDLAGA